MCRHSLVVFLLDVKWGVCVHVCACTCMCVCVQRQLGENPEEMDHFICLYS